MPYHILYKKGTAKPWKLIKTATGEIVGSSETKKEAEASIKARYAGEYNKKKEYIKKLRKEK